MKEGIGGYHLGGGDSGYYLGDETDSPGFLSFGGGTGK